MVQGPRTLALMASQSFVYQELTERMTIVIVNGTLKCDMFTKSHCIRKIGNISVVFDHVSAVAHHVTMWCIGSLCGARVPRDVEMLIKVFFRASNGHGEGHLVFSSFRHAF